MMQKRATSEKIANARRWNNHLKLWQSSGLTQAEYCRRNNISEKSFGYWLRKDRRSNVPKLQLIPLQMTAEPVLNQTVESFSGLYFKLSNSTRLEITKGFDSETFARVISIIARL